MSTDTAGRFLGQLINGPHNPIPREGLKVREKDRRLTGLFTLVVFSALALLAASAATGAAAVKACSLVTKAEVGVVLGLPASKLALVRDATTANSNVCEYRDVNYQTAAGMPKVFEILYTD